MNTMFEVLEKGGFITDSKSQKKFEPYWDICQIELPFGENLAGYEGIRTNYVQDVLNGINYIRRTSEAVTKKEINDLCPSLKYDNYKRFLLDNWEKVRVINKGTFRRESHGYIGRAVETDYEVDTPFGYANIAFGFCFSQSRLKVQMKFDPFVLHRNYQDRYKDMIFNDPNYIDRGKGESNEEKLLEIFKKLIPYMEFIPLWVNEEDGVVLSHMAYKDEQGFRHSKVTSPCLGVNIKKHDDMMEGLVPWFERGGVIRDDVFYLICKDRKSGNGGLYLKRYEEWSPRQKGQSIVVPE